MEITDLSRLYFSDYLELKSYKSVGEKHGVSPGSIQTICSGLKRELRKRAYGHLGDEAWRMNKDQYLNPKKYPTYWGDMMDAHCINVDLSKNDTRKLKDLTVSEFINILRSVQ